MDKIEFGLKIRNLREERKLTQMEFAEMIDITDKALSRIEVGRNLPHLNTLVAMSKVLNVSVEFLIADDIPAKIENLNFMHSVDCNF